MLTQHGRDPYQKSFTFLVTEGGGIIISERDRWDWSYRIVRFFPETTEKLT